MNNSDNDKGQKGGLCVIQKTALTNRQNDDNKRRSKDDNKNSGQLHRSPGLTKEL